MSDLAIRVPVSRQDIFENPPMVTFLACMRDVIFLREAIEATRRHGLSIAGSDERAQVREQLIGLACDLLVKRLEQELNNALGWLDEYFQKKEATP